MNLIDQLRSEQKPERPPGKRAASTYLTPEQYERLELIAEKSGLSQSKVLARLVDLAYDRLVAKAQPL